MSFFQLLLSVFVYGVYSYILMLVTIVPFPLAPLSNFQGYDMVGLVYFLILLLLVTVVGLIRSLKNKKMLFNINFRFLRYTIIVQLIMLALWAGYTMSDLGYILGIIWNASLLVYMVLYGIAVFTTLFGKKIE